MVFDFEKAFIQHMKKEHGEANTQADNAKVELCPQVVFACGFVNCKDRVFEAADDDEARTVADRYFEHVASHFDKRNQDSGWEYYVQIHNLLKQRRVKELWKQNAWNKDLRNQLRWQPRSSGDLKKMLECRHLGEVGELVHTALTLGQTCFTSPDQPPPELVNPSARPIKSQCHMFSLKHKYDPNQPSNTESPYDFRISHLKPPTPHAVFAPTAQRRSNTPVAKLPDPPRSVPAESNSDWPHPGTLHPIPEVNSWSPELEAFGPPEAGQIHGAGGQVFDHVMVDAESPQMPYMEWTQPYPYVSRPLMSNVDSSSNPANSPREKPLPKRNLSFAKRSMGSLKLRKKGNSTVNSPLTDAPQYYSPEQQAAYPLSARQSPVDMTPFPLA
jgi:hypothetical protein